MNTIQFSHANGFPAKSYNYLFSMLPDYKVSFVEKIGHGQHPLNNDLSNYARELILDIEQKQQIPVIGIGHSLGAVVTLLAAAQRPDLFREVILLDPVLFSKRKRFTLGVAKRVGLIDKITPAARTAKRRAHFPSREDAAAYLRGKSLFKTFHQRCFEDYIQHGLVDSENGVELAFSPQVEADVFRNIMLKAPNYLKQVKGHAIYGKKSNLFNHNDKRWWQRNFPNMQLIGIDGGHLFPLEQPVETAAQIEQILSGSSQRQAN